MAKQICMGKEATMATPIPRLIPMHTRGPKTQNGISQLVIVKGDKRARAPGVPLWAKWPPDPGRKVAPSKGEPFEGGLVKVKAVQDLLADIHGVAHKLLQPPALHLCGDIVCSLIGRSAGMFTILLLTGSHKSLGS
jgi:hypothetical protein